MMKTRVLFPNPMNAADDEAMNEFLSAFGVSPDSGGQSTTDTNTTDTDDTNNTDPTTDESQSNQTDQTDQTDSNVTSQDQDSQENTQNQTQQTDNKMSQAFAQMRVQNRNMEKMLKGVAEVLGIQDVNNPETLTQALNKKILAAQAQKQGVPPELLEEINNLKTAVNENNLKEIRQNAFLGFQQVKDAFKLDDQKLDAFADTLVQEGLNPFEQPINLMNEYRLRNFDSLLAEAKAQGIREEQERAARAGAHSSTPGNKQGQGGGDVEKVTTISGLTNWLEKNN